MYKKEAVRSSPQPEPHSPNPKGSGDTNKARLRGLFVRFIRSSISDRTKDENYYTREQKMRRNLTI